MAEPIIGRGPKPTPTSSPKQTILGLGDGGLGSKIAGAGASVGLSKVYNTLPAIGTIDFVTNLTKAQMQQIIPYLDKFGASPVDITTVDNAKKYLQNNFNTYVENSGGSLTKLIQLFKNDYIPTSDASSGPQSNGVVQYVTKKSPELVKQNVDKFLLDTIGSTNIKKESRDKIMVEINKLLTAGTTTTTKMDKTGKQTVTQTPGYSDELAGAKVASLAKTLEPEKYAQQKQASFFDFMQQADQMRGGR